MREDNRSADVASGREWKDPRKLVKQSDIAQQLITLTARENEVSLELDAIIARRSNLDESTARLKALVPKIKNLSYEVNGRQDVQAPTTVLFPRADRAQDSDNAVSEDDYGNDIEEDEGLVERVTRVWTTSERVGGKVRKLDVEVSRMKEALERVNEVLELKSALQCLREAIPKYDWELATRCCKRAMEVSPEVLNSAFAARVVPSSSDPLPPAQALQSLRDSLLVTFKAEFKAAAELKDEQATSRYFKLFPVIDAKDDGLDVYGDFVTTLVKGRSPTGGKPSSPAYYIAHLTNLLESIALIVDQHQSIVEKYYGTGRMLVVIERLQLEADKVVKTLVEGWEDERRVGRLISETRQSQFQYLNNPLPAIASSVAASSLTALSQAQQNLASLPGAATSLLAQYAGNSNRKDEQHNTVSAGIEVTEPVIQEGPDPRDVDKIVGEMVTLSGRWALYRRFVSSRLEEFHQLQCISDSESSKVIVNMLRTYYEPLEIWYLRSSVEKAHRIDTPDLTTRPHISSVVDDVFYILKLVTNRMIVSGSVQTFTAMRESIGRIIERDFVGILQKKLDTVYSGSNAALAALSGTLAAINKEAERERKEKDLRISYCVLLNDLDLSATYTERLVEDIINGESAKQWFLPEEISRVHAELKIFAEVAHRMRSVSKAGLDHLFNQLNRPRLRSLVEDVFKGVSYVLDEDSYAEAEVQDVVRKRFIRGWEPLIDGYKSSFTDSNFQNFFSMNVETLVRPWEKMVLGMRFTELGAIRFDRDVRGVANYLASHTDFGGPREKFVRLQQMATTLNLGADEDPEEFYGSSGIAWRLSKSEYDAIISLKVI